MWYIWNYIVEQNHKCNGYLVQKVSVSCSVSPCKTKQNPNPKAKTDAYTYFELVGKVASFRPNIIAGQDKAKWPPPVNTCGEYSQDGEARFFCHTKAIGAEIDKWAPGEAGKAGICRTHSGEFPMKERRGDFHWWSRSDERPATRHFTASWKCCPDEDQMVRGTADPKKDDDTGDDKK